MKLHIKGDSGADGTVAFLEAGLSSLAGDGGPRFYEVSPESLKIFCATLA